MNIAKYLSEELDIRPKFIGNVLSLFNDNATIPFIARYRKEATAGLDETVLRRIQERYEYLTELDERKKTVLNTIREQGRLTDELHKKIDSCMEKIKLEDMYLPYKPKRKTRATKAREQGLEPLLSYLLVHTGDAEMDLAEEAKKFINTEKEVNTAQNALQGASDIYAEMVSEKAENREFVREFLLQEGVFCSKVRMAFKGKKTKYEMYHDYRIPVKKIASHNMLALRRAETDKVVLFDVEADMDKILKELYSREITFDSGPVSAFLKGAIQDAYKRLIKLSISTEIRLQKKREAEMEAIVTFEKNLRNLLLAAPAGAVAVLAVDPGFRSGCKVTALDKTGNFLEFKAIFPHGSKKQEKDAQNTLLELIKNHSPEFVAIGNGTASRETERFVKKSLKEYEGQKSPHVVLISEAGASVYSASDSAIKEFPDLDITVRGAISIGRRLINPLAELVKIDPKSIGVGQYQHDVDQQLLKKKLSEVVESCVNYVGVDLNSASVELLSCVSGINIGVAGKIVERLKEKGPFRGRKELLDVSGVGKKVFEQASGFLRIKNGENPLDDSSVHPESYHIVENISENLGLPIKELIGNTSVLNRLDASQYTDDTAGQVTVKDIIEELKKPGLDPRSDFTYAHFDDSVNNIEDLKEGMKLQGVVTNVANFGAFVDLGVHQDGLVHISQMSQKFVKDPTTVVSVGDQIHVTVLNIDKELGRISLSMK